MNYLIKKHITLLPVVFFAALLFIACSQEKVDSQGKATSYNTTATSAKDKQDLKEAPDFTLQKMNGEMFTLSKHRGQVIVLNFWATWCPPCRKEIPDFIEIQKNMSNEGVLFVGVSLDKEGWEVVKPFAKKYGINYPLMVINSLVYKKYGPFRGIPTTFIINKEGKVAYVALGMVGKKQLKNVLKKLTG